MTSNEDSGSVMDAGAAPTRPGEAGFSMRAPSSDLLAQAAALGAANAGPAPPPPPGASDSGAPAPFVTSAVDVHIQSEGLSAGPARIGP